MALTQITQIPQLYRNLVRSREIVAVLSKYGLAEWLDRLGIDIAKGLFKSPAGEGLVDLSHEQRIRLALTEIGVTGIKLGQVLSTRPDVVGIELATELERLQVDTPPDPAETVLQTIEEDLGRPAEEVFAEFEAEPIASASVGQVHRARLPGGEQVVVKVQHRNVARRVEVDLEILKGLAGLAANLEEFANYQPRAVVEEAERTLRRELDYGREQAALLEFRELFAGRSEVHIPAPFAEYSSSRVLTMERLDGISLADRERLRRAGLDLEEVARRGARLYLEMIFEHGVYHADPHPGNILILDDDVVGLIDFGMIGRLDESLQDDIEAMLMALAEGDGVLLTSILARVGSTPSDYDRASLSIDVGDFVGRFSRMPVDRFDLTGALREMTDLIRKYRITLPARLAMLIKTLIQLEGSARRLAPSFNLIELIRAFRLRLLRRHLSPQRQLRKLRRLESEVRAVLETVPRGLVDIVEQLRSGEFEVHLDHRGLAPSINRLVIGMLASALFLGSSLLLSRNVPPLVWGFSVLGAVGAVFSLILGLRLARAIAHTGHLDRPVDKKRERGRRG